MVRPGSGCSQAMISVALEKYGMLTKIYIEREDEVICATKNPVQQHACSICPVKYLTHPLLNSKVVRSKWICQITCYDHAYAHTRTYTHTYIHIHTHTHIHTLTYIHTYIHIHTYHTHILYNRIKIKLWKKIAQLVQW